MKVVHLPWDDLCKPSPAALGSGPVLQTAAGLRVPVGLMVPAECLLLPARVVLWVLLAEPATLTCIALNEWPEPSRLAVLPSSFSPYSQSGLVIISVNCFVPKAEKGWEGGIMSS